MRRVEQREVTVLKYDRHLWPEDQGMWMLMVYRRQGASGVRLCSIAWYHQGPQAGCQAVCKGAAAAADSSSAASLLIYDKLVDQQCMHIHKMLDLLQRRYKAPTSAPAPKPNSRSDSSSDS
eukprot:scaffold75252_cov16-Tisochrysis_lutea.AAC.1